MGSFKRFIIVYLLPIYYKVSKYVLAATYVSVLLTYSIIAYYKSNNRKKHNDLKILWGPIPLKNIKYNSLSLKKYGFDSNTCVDGFYPSINKLSDFDYYYDDFIPRVFGRYKFIGYHFRSYLVFIWFLKNYDILITNYDGAILSRTPLRFCEGMFIKIARKKLIVWPYGSDTYILSRMIDHSFKYGIYKSYPYLAGIESKVKKQITYFEKYANFIIGNIPHNEVCSRNDILAVACYCLDEQEWSPSSDYSYKNDGINNSVTILHCPNHDDVKGTQFLIKAVEALCKTGLKIDLKIVKGVQNDELRDMMRKADIVAAQFLYGYAATEIEGMSLAKPVLSNLSNDYYYTVARRYTYFSECPILSTSPENITENIRKLVVDPDLREKLGRHGREYFMKYHSLEGQGLFWSRIVHAVANNSAEKLSDWWLERSN